jgi:hypothetical protein
VAVTRDIADENVVAPAAATYSCDGCRRVAFILHAVDGGAKLCEGCAEKSARIDRRLATTVSDDAVFCDGCGDRAAFDARVAVVVRECGGIVLCDHCEPTRIERAPS